MKEFNIGAIIAGIPLAVFAQCVGLDITRNSMIVWVLLNAFCLALLALLDKKYD